MWQEQDRNAVEDVASGVYERERPLREGEVVLDIGAHVGSFTVRAMERVGRGGAVVAFEPEPRNIAQWRERVEEYARGGRRNAIVSATPRPGKACLVEAAAWDADARVAFHCNSAHTGGHSVIRNHQHDGEVQVMAVDIGSWLAQRRLRPDFVKIDTEGAETRILASLLRAGWRPYVAYEAHSVELYHECRALLEAYGYKVTPKEEWVGVCYGKCGMNHELRTNKHESGIEI